MNRKLREVISVVEEDANTQNQITNCKMINPGRFEIIASLRHFLVGRDLDVKLKEKSIEPFTIKYHERTHNMMNEEFLSRSSCQNPNDCRGTTPD